MVFFVSFKLQQTLKCRPPFFPLFLFFFALRYSEKNMNLFLFRTPSLTCSFLYSCSAFFLLLLSLAFVFFYSSFLTETRRKNGNISSGEQREQAREKGIT